MPSHESVPHRGAFLQFMHNVYAIYLGVTPPTPEKEKKIAAAVLGGTVLLVVFLFFFVRFLMSAIFAR